jgi:hypothetical protein
MSLETREKMSIARKGEKHPMYGKKHTKESIQKMSEKLKGHTPWNKGKTGIFSDETRLRLSQHLLDDRQLMELNTIMTGLGSDNVSTEEIDYLIKKIKEAKK